MEDHVRRFDFANFAGKVTITVMLSFGGGMKGIVAALFDCRVRLAPRGVHCGTLLQFQEWRRRVHVADTP
ncbi:MAG TPA: hypothetical protein VMA37_07770 [Acetobacteraceae bacterium]|nr:hypothetical protein [Acetobacteraceae bacterium]